MCYRGNFYSSSVPLGVLAKAPFFFKVRSNSFQTKLIYGKMIRQTVLNDEPNDDSELLYECYEIEEEDNDLISFSIEDIDEKTDWNSIRDVIYRNNGNILGINIINKIFEVGFRKINEMNRNKEAECILWIYAELLTRESNVNKQYLSQLFGFICSEFISRPTSTTYVCKIIYLFEVLFDSYHYIIPDQIISILIFYLSSLSGPIVISKPVILKIIRESLNGDNIPKFESSLIPKCFNLLDDNEISNHVISLEIIAIWLKNTRNCLDNNQFDKIIECIDRPFLNVKTCTINVIALSLNCETSIERCIQKEIIYLLYRYTTNIIFESISVVIFSFYSQISEFSIDACQQIFSCIENTELSEFPYECKKCIIHVIHSYTVKFNLKIDDAKYIALISDMLYSEEVENVHEALEILFNYEILDISENILDPINQLIDSEDKENSSLAQIISEKFKKHRTE